MSVPSRAKKALVSSLLNRLSLKGKLLGSVLLIYVSTMILAMGLFLSYQWNVLKVASLEDLNILAGITADSLTSSLLFDHGKDAGPVLAALKNQTSVRRAGIFRSDGTVFATYAPDSETIPVQARPDGMAYRFTKDGVEVFQDVVFQGKTIGYVSILSDLRHARSIITLSMLGMFVIFSLALCVTVFLTAGLQRSITRPLTHLAEVARQVADTGDYSIRGTVQYDDEIGELTEAFNRMMARISEGEVHLRDSEARFRMIFQHNPNPISICRMPDGVWLDVNDQFREVTGYGREDLKGKTGLDIGLWCVDGDRERFFKPLEKNSMVSGLEATLRRKGGDTFHAVISAATIDLEGQPYLISIMKDVTETKKAQKAVKEYQDRLEQLVEERTRQLEEAQAELLQRERLSVLGQLTATVGHEIRNPLGTVRNAVFSIGDAYGKGERKRLERALKLAERNIIRADGIIGELLYYSRRRELHLVKTEIDAWLVNILSEQEVPEEVELVPALDSRATIPIDREKMRRAFLNVLNNGIQAVQEKDCGRGTLTVNTRISDGELHINVDDDGAGIGEENLPRIFEPLFSTKSFGVGLGMSIVKNILKEHDGTVQVDSKEGVGTSVSLRIPVMEGVANEASQGFLQWR